ncbi:hypothetical protein [Cytobacillus oceanisediminis]|uniref:hypothetical protein n=1 Tax=Cytobacillus oceanisediminis TaxID=665099 RepID=UPI001643608A|nr:hypothetical protein [Cytobacillus oceanisediminis]
MEKRIKDVVEMMGVGDGGKEKVESFCGGMKGRVNIGGGILDNGELLMMDEWSVGMDGE